MLRSDIVLCTVLFAPRVLKRIKYHSDKISVTPKRRHAQKRKPRFGEHKENKMEIIFAIGGSIMGIIFIAGIFNDEIATIIKAFKSKKDKDDD